MIARALLRAVERAEVESRWLPQLIGDAEEVAAARAIRACFVLALERYRVRGLLDPPGEEFEALLRVTLGAEPGELKLRYAVVNDWLQDHGLEPEEQRESLDLFAWHLGRIRLADERAAVAWLGPAPRYFSGPLNGSWAFFLRLHRPPPGRPSRNPAE
ncbi:MAG TPA: hypothetical protein VGN57_05760 [Pirellulaceae bacterium]|nr:hypothetical protein [Pirellulaceae bacterium]